MMNKAMKIVIALIFATLFLFAVASHGLDVNGL